jgi:hypothetical protein
MFGNICYYLWVPVNFFIKNIDKVKATPEFFLTTVLQLKDRKKQSEFHSALLQK